MAAKRPAPASKSGLYADPREEWLAQPHRGRERLARDRRPAPSPLGPRRLRIDRRTYGCRHRTTAIHRSHRSMSIAARCTAPTGGGGGRKPFVPSRASSHGVAAMSASGGYGSGADQCRHSSARQSVAGDGWAKPVWKQRSRRQRPFRGIRHSAAWDAEPRLPGMLADGGRGASGATQTFARACAAWHSRPQF